MKVKATQARVRSGHVCRRAAPDSTHAREELVLGGLEGGVHGLGVGRLAQVLEEVGAVREQAEAREDVEVELVVRAADQEEEVRAGSVLRAEEDGAHGAAEREERLLEEVGVVVARMQQRDAGIKAGAEGCTTIVIRDGKLMIPPDWNMDEQTPELASKIRKDTGITADDVIIVGGGSSKIAAVEAVLNAAFELV